jgi:hypothetical protein
MEWLNRDEVRIRPWLPPHLHGRLPWSFSRAARPAKAAAELSEPNASPWSCCRPRYRPAALSARPPGLQASIEQPTAHLRVLA